MKFSCFAASALGIVLGCFALTGGAAAGTVPSPATSQFAAPKAVTLVGHRKYDARKHGHRVKIRTGKYVHFHGGYWYASPWWTVAVPPVVVGVPAFGTPAWYGYCKAKYKTWDPRRGKWRNSKGVWVPCV
jgi:hypothetical protein